MNKKLLLNNLITFSSIRKVFKLFYWVISLQLFSKLKRRKVAQILSQSGLFDPEYYDQQNPDVKGSGRDLLGHYLDIGAKLGKDPNPLFNTAYYLKNYPDVLASNLNPLYHYITLGYQKGYNPHPLFNTTYYIKTYSDVVESGINPLLHYLTIGFRENRPTFPCQALESVYPKQSSKKKTGIPLSLDTNYQAWLNSHYPCQQELKQMVDESQHLTYKPLISIIIPSIDSYYSYLSTTLESVFNQTYFYWEILIIENLEIKKDIDAIIAPKCNFNNQIKRIDYDSQTSTTFAYNLAINEAQGEFITFLYPNDLLTPHALYQVAKLLNLSSQADLIYSDEDSIDGHHYLSQPFFKPDWCPDSFLSRRYIGGLTVYRRSLVHKIEGFKVENEELKEFDLLLRLTEKTKKIYHIADILYHRRINESREVKDHHKPITQQLLTTALIRRNEPAIIVDVPYSQKDFIVRYEIKNYDLVSIIIPTKNLGELLNQCLISIFEKTTYPNFEIILVDNGSTEHETIQIINNWLHNKPNQIKKLRIDIPFNYSTLNNLAVQASKGKYLLFLNNDIEVITSDWIERMLEQAQRPSIGAVGALLLFSDNTIQHAGIVAGIFNFCGHSHKRFQLGESGYFNQLNTINNYLAVTGACLMCRREVFEKVGGFDETLAVNFNDVDLCFKMVQKGYNNVYLPHVRLYHYESKSRGYDFLNTAKKARFLCEMKYFQTRWKSWIENDPCYNPHLTRQSEDYSLRIVSDFELNL